MQKAPKAKCDKCTLKGSSFVPSEINNKSITLLAEAPAKTEVIEGKPLVGIAGQKLQKIIQSLGAQRTDFNYVNTVSCRAFKPDDTNRNPNEDEIMWCNERLIAELINIPNQRAIVVLGRIPYTGLNGKMPSTFRVGDVAGTSGVWRNIKTFYTYHPAAIAHAGKIENRVFIENNIRNAIKDAMELSLKEEQLAMFDVNTFQTINTNRPKTVVEMDLFRALCNAFWQSDTKCKNCIQNFYCEDK